MSDSTNQKIIIGLRQVSADLLVKAGEHSKTQSPVAQVLMKAMEEFADRIAGHAAEMEAGLGGPNAGSTAYEMMAAAEIANVETTEMLMQMLAATILSVVIDEDGGGRASVSYSPDAMDMMMRRYDLEATRDGMITTVRIKPRPGAFPGLEVETHTIPPAGLADSMRLTDEPADSGPADPQAAPHNYDRPLWAARVDGVLKPASDRKEAERLVSTADMGQIAQIENRFCYHVECPAERCNLAQSGRDDEEVTSDA